MSYLKIIKAKRAEMDARKLAEKLEGERQELACSEAFKDFRDVWKEVANLMVPDFRYHSHKLVPFTEHLARPYGFAGSAEMETTPVLGFYAGGGNLGPCFYCEWDELSAEVVFLYACGSDPVLMTKAELMERFLNFLASRIE